MVSILFWPQCVQENILNVIICTVAHNWWLPGVDLTTPLGGVKGAPSNTPPGSTQEIADIGLLLAKLCQKMCYISHPYDKNREEE